MEGERYAPTTFLSRRPARRRPAHWHPRGGGHADGYLSPPAGTGPAPATCGKLHILRAVRRPPPDTRRRATPRSQPDRHRRRRPRHAEAQGAVLCRPGADVVRRPSPRHAEARGPGRTRRRRGGRAGRGARGEGRRAPARRRGGQPARQGGQEGREAREREREGPEPLGLSRLRACARRARGGTRTPMIVRSHGPEPCASTNSATRARSEADDSRWGPPASNQSAPEAGETRHPSDPSAPPPHPPGHTGYDGPDGSVPAEEPVILGGEEHGVPGQVRKGR